MEQILAAAKNVNSLADVMDIAKDVAKEVAYQQTPLEKMLSEATSNANWNVSNTIKYIICCY